LVAKVGRAGGKRKSDRLTFSVLAELCADLDAMARSAEAASGFLFSPSIDPISRFCGGSGASFTRNWDWQKGAKTCVDWCSRLRHKGCDARDSAAERRHRIDALRENHTAPSRKGIADYDPNRKIWVA